MYEIYYELVIFMILPTCSYQMYPNPFFVHDMYKIKRRSTASAQLSPTNYRHRDKHLRLVMTLIPNIKVVGQTVQPREVGWMDGQTDAIKYIISFAVVKKFWGNLVILFYLRIKHIHGAKTLKINPSGTFCLIIL